MVINIDTHKRSDQAEAVILHHDIIHNPRPCSTLSCSRFGTTGRHIEDQLRQWNKTIERYGLKLVEAYVTQISDIRDRNAFQSRSVRLAVPPPAGPDLHLRVPEGTHTDAYALLRRFGLILDVEASDLYPDEVGVLAVHPSVGGGVHSAQGGTEGFLWARGKEEKRRAETLRVDWTHCVRSACWRTCIGGGQANAS
ncbi:hypothetical protein BDZ89DRAFT_1152247 [Hymenopellis radicata]|nr:hypothetical protein BDZ89DRAFT_1152247 [Hymenopellis radicata]